MVQFFEIKKKGFKLRENILISEMGLERELEALRRRVQRVAPIKAPPELKMNIYSEKEWNNKKPTCKNKWEIDLVIEEKRPLM